MIKPHLWPQIKFLSSRGQESQRLLWFSNKLSGPWSEVGPKASGVETLSPGYYITRQFLAPENIDQ